MQAALIQLGKEFYPQLWRIISGGWVLHVITCFGAKHDRL